MKVPGIVIGPNATVQQVNIKITTYLTFRDPVFVAGYTFIVNAAGAPIHVRI